MGDIDVSVNMKMSGANGLFNEIMDLKRQKKAIEEKIEFKTQELIDYIVENGNILAYKDDIPHIVMVGTREQKVFNKAQLAQDTGRSENELNVIGIAELVENKHTSSDQLRSYYHIEPKQVLKARKATKKDLELFRSRKLI